MPGNTKAKILTNKKDRLLFNVLAMDLTTAKECRQKTLTHLDKFMPIFMDYIFRAIETELSSSYNFSVSLYVTDREIDELYKSMSEYKSIYSSGILARAIDILGDLGFYVKLYEEEYLCISWRNSK